MQYLSVKILKNPDIPDTISIVSSLKNIALANLLTKGKGKTINMRSNKCCLVIRSIPVYFPSLCLILDIK